MLGADKATARLPADLLLRHSESARRAATRRERMMRVAAAIQQGAVPVVSAVALNVQFPEMRERQLLALHGLRETRLKSGVGRNRKPEK